MQCCFIVESYIILFIYTAANVINYTFYSKNCHQLTYCWNVIIIIQLFCTCILIYYVVLIWTQRELVSYVVYATGERHHAWCVLYGVHIRSFPLGACLLVNPRPCVSVSGILSAIFFRIVRNGSLGLATWGGRFFTYRPAISSVPLFLRFVHRRCMPTHKCIIVNEYHDAIIIRI